MKLGGVCRFGEHQTCQVEIVDLDDAFTRGLVLSWDYLLERVIQ